jgi:hypothetical protein
MCALYIYIYVCGCARRLICQWISGSRPEILTILENLLTGALDSTFRVMPVVDADTFLTRMNISTCTIYS